ncbi:MAG: DUF2063 domain-containing protein [Gemmatimonas sp.]
MPGLRDLQRDFAAAITGGSVDPLTRHIRPAPLGPERRIAIYRNHFVITLTESLGITFPVLKALVGEAFFDQSARRFAEMYPPTSPVLFEYGERFPHFLRDETRSSEFDYLVDVGVFEWAINHAYHAADADPLDANALLRVSPEQRADIALTFHPSVRLLTSAYPVLDLWRAHQPGREAEVIDISKGGVRLLVWRHGIDVVWQMLTPAEHAFCAALATGAPLAKACGAALAVDASFDAGATLHDMFTGHTVAGIAVDNSPDHPC